ncbi:hypothetical protein BGZ94_000165, partial [Podila epigama]
MSEETNQQQDVLVISLKRSPTPGPEYSSEGSKQLSVEQGISEPQQHLEQNQRPEQEHGSFSENQAHPHPDYQGHQGYVDHQDHRVDHINHQQYQNQQADEQHQERQGELYPIKPEENHQMYPIKHENFELSLNSLFAPFQTMANANDSSSNFNYDTNVDAPFNFQDRDDQNDSKGQGHESSNDLGYDGADYDDDERDGVGNHSKQNNPSQRHTPAKRALIEERLRMERPNRTLFVRNIEYGINEADIRQLYEPFGEISNVCNLIENRGMIFITFYDIRAAETAKAKTHLQVLQKRKGTLFVHLKGAGKDDIDDVALGKVFGQWGEVKSIRRHKTTKQYVN